MNTRFKVFASYNILQYLCDFIHVLIFVTISKCRKSPKLTNIVIRGALGGGQNFQIQPLSGRTLVEWVELEKEITG
jgi:hypothetical protein